MSEIFLERTPPNAGPKTKPAATMAPSTDIGRMRVVGSVQSAMRARLTVMLCFIRPTGIRERSNSGSECSSIAT